MAGISAASETDIRDPPPTLKTSVSGNALIGTRFVIAPACAPSITSSSATASISGHVGAERCSTTLVMNLLRTKPARARAQNAVFEIITKLAA